MVRTRVKNIAVVKIGGNYICSEPNCNRNCARYYQYEDHMNSHRGLAPHMCDQKGCTFRSSDRSNLARHRINVHKLARRGKQCKRGSARDTRAVRGVSVASSASSSNPVSPPVKEEVELAIEAVKMEVAIEGVELEVTTAPSELHIDQFGRVVQAVRDMMNVRRCPFCSTYAGGSVYGIAIHIAENHSDVTTMILNNGHN